MKIIAVILAGGSGSRLGGELPKQFLRIEGKTIVEHSVDAFESHPAISAVVVVCRAEWLGYMRELLESKPHPKLKGVIAGGEERWHSSVNALKLLESESDSVGVMIHDAVRPCVSARIISDCAEALKTGEAVCTAVKTTDTIMILDENGCVGDIPRRALLRNSQTPQCFSLGLIREAYVRALEDPRFTATDDTGVVRRYVPEAPIAIVDGESTNIKVTFPEDLITAARILSERK
ncbi:MAG: 2-C-methyl-D-erythritol 4-phosphate cytidylyltransferase [Bacteroidales bacterium]|nr:2-C-methyl-D-erythritol 4-phosphate cytidylyltransferase [Bacteroidales bacterium]